MFKEWLDMTWKWETKNFGILSGPNIVAKIVDERLYWIWREWVKGLSSKEMLWQINNKWREGKK